jgi:hypothetical protein
VEAAAGFEERREADGQGEESVDPWDGGVCGQMHSVIILKKG